MKLKFVDSTSQRQEVWCVSLLGKFPVTSQYDGQFANRNWKEKSKEWSKRKEKKWKKNKTNERMKEQMWMNAKCADSPYFPLHEDAKKSNWVFVIQWQRVIIHSFQPLFSSCCKYNLGTLCNFLQLIYLFIYLSSKFEWIFSSLCECLSITSHHIISS